MDIITFLEKRMFACRVYRFACFSLVFCLLSTAHFSRLVHKIAEAGTKGNMSYLDSPDAYITVPEEERPPSRFFADEGYSLCTSVFFNCLNLKW